MNHQTPPRLDRVLETAVQAAHRAGGILRHGWRGPKSIEFKGEIDLVTDFDLASEEELTRSITRAFPDHAVLAEESGQGGVASPFRWYVDPLDGTTNFAHGFPVFCVSIGFEAPGPDGPEMMAGVVYDPIRDETFSAAKGQGAVLNGRPISVSAQTDLGRSLLATGFPYDIRENPDPILKRFKRMILAAQAVRRPGSAALDLAWTAAGRVDGFWEEGLRPWDTAAGAILVREAGGRVTDFSDRPYDPASKEILATNGHVHYNMRHILTREHSGRSGI